MNLPSVSSGTRISVIGIPDPREKSVGGDSSPIAMEIGTRPDFQFVRAQSGLTKRIWNKTSLNEFLPVAADHRDHVMFAPLDLIPYPGFFDALKQETECLGTGKSVREFLIIPVVRLTAEGLEMFHRTTPELRFRKMLAAIVEGDRSLVRCVECCPGVGLYNRLWFLHLGGFRNEFKSFAYAATDLGFRAVVAHDGFRMEDPRRTPGAAMEALAMYGELSLRKGLFLLAGPAGTAAKELDLAHDAKVFGEILSHAEPVPLDPLPCPESGRSLIFRENPFTSNHHVLPLWGELVEANEDDFQDEDAFATYLAEESIKRVVFHNPYACDGMRRVYDWVRKRGIAFVVCERGALGGSFFYDTSGFLVDGSSYVPEHWDRELSVGERERAIDFIDREISGSVSLEQQRERRSPASIRRALGIPAKECVVLITLQRPGDSVTRHFHRAGYGYSSYLEDLKVLALMRLPHVRFLVKNHPLEDEKLEINCQTVDDFHINDLIECSDYMVTFNSGTGVQALLWNKPVIVFGNAFYAAEGVAATVSGPQEAAALISAGWAPDKEKVLRFLHYLAFEFYSFGKFNVTETWENEQRMTATVGIEPSVIRIGGTEIDFGPGADLSDSAVYKTYAKERANAESAVPGDKELEYRKLATAVVLPSVPRLFLEDMENCPQRIDAYQEFYPGVALGYGGNKSDLKQGFELSKAGASRSALIPLSNRHEFRIRQRCRALKWCMLEFTMSWNFFSEHPEFNLLFVMRSHRPVTVRSGLYLPRSNGGGIEQQVNHQILPLMALHRNTFRLSAPQAENFEWDSPPKVVISMDAVGDLDLVLSMLEIEVAR